MFRSAIVKLTLWQLAALSLVCLLFSIPAYNIAAARLRRGAEQQTAYIQRYPGNAPQGLVPFLLERREEQLRKDRHELVISLVTLNTAILLLGTVGSYLFARRTLRPIEESHAAQNRFTADASHELRTPLATMQTEIDVALRDKQLSIAEAKAVLRNNLEDIARLRSLSEQLLCLTRMDTKNITTKQLALSKIVRSEVKRLEKLHNVRIALQLDKNIFVRGNDDLLKQLVSIFVDNAVKYAGNNKPDITITTKRAGKRVELQIHDKGIGIAAADLPFVFDRFYRGASVESSAKQGHGLGLSLAKAIAETHDGDIIVQSASGTGTIFTVSLPSA